MIRASLRAMPHAALLSALLLVLAVPATVSAGCSSSSTVASTPDAATADGGTSAEAGVTAKILKPADHATFTTAEKVPVSGTASAVAEGPITDPARLAWNIVDNAGIINPEGEGTADDIGPFDAGTYEVRFIAKSLAGATATDKVTITVQ